ncbi:MAG: hypothetical protein ACI9UR_002095 [Bacteroidia bacterium]|jgi:hypothetical protein
MADRKSIRIKFVGDVSFNNDYIPLLEAGNNPFKAVEPFLSNADLVVGNLECLASGTGENEKKVPRIKTSAKALDALNFINLGLVSLATNHVYDNLEEGFQKSRAKLDELGIDCLGAALSEDTAQLPHVFESGGWKIGFLNYVHEDTNPKLPDGAGVYPNKFGMHKIIEDINGLKDKVDKVVVLLHWGGKCDYGYLPHKEQIAQAKTMVDAGADAIIGHHTHTFQTSIEYKKAPVYFSIGNFCFDDIVMGDRNFRIRESGRKSGVVEIEFFDSKETKHEVFPFRINGFDLIPDASLTSEFKTWKNRFWFIRNVPGMYSLYYFLLRRLEPVHFHAQINNTTLSGIAFSKVKRILRIG